MTALLSLPCMINQVLFCPIFIELLCLWASALWQECFFRAQDDSISFVRDMFEIYWSYSSFVFHMPLVCTLQWIDSGLWDPNLLTMRLNMRFLWFYDTFDWSFEAKQLTRLKCSSRNFRSLASLFWDVTVSVGSSSAVAADPC